MYYMQARSKSPATWSSKGLLRLLRATLPPERRAPAGRTLAAPPGRLSSEQLSELAVKWRRRSAEGDEGADSVAMALEQLAERRAMERPTRIKAVGQRLSQLMQLD